MYQKFNLENLQQVRLLIYDLRNETLEMLLSGDGDGSKKLNMSRSGEDDKAIGIDTLGFCTLIVPLMEQVTQKKFAPLNGYDKDLLVYGAIE